MAYQFDFMPVVENTDLLLRGALFTLELTAIGAVTSPPVGVAGSAVMLIAFAVATVLAENPHFVFTDRERRGYGVAEFTPRQLEVSLRVVDDVTRTDSGISTLARFAVEQGQPKLHNA